MTAIGVRGRSPRVDRADRVLRTRSDALRGAAVAVVLIGVIGSVLLARAWQATVTRQRDERLDRTATSRTVTIATALANYESALQAARSLWLASNSIDRQEFSTFARSLDLRDRYPGLQAIGWRSLVTDDKVDEFVAENRADGEPTFTIRPPGRRPVYYVTIFSYPRIPSSSALGADARATPSILATLERARDNGMTTMSNQTTLPGDLDLPADQRPVAFELVVPVYEKEVRPDDTLAERRKALVGWATGQFRAGDFLAAAMKTAPAFTGVELHDEDVDEDGPVASYPAGFRATGRLVREKQFALGGRSFVLRYAPLPGNAILTERTVPAPLVLTMGIAASILLGTLLWLLAQVGPVQAAGVRRPARPRPLQGLQRRARPPGGRPAAEGGGRGVARVAAGHRRAGPLRRRGVRGRPPPLRPRGCAGSDREAAQGHAR
jgi:CHASE1-domain containing sensor protein